MRIKIRIYIDRYKQMYSSITTSIGSNNNSSHLSEAVELFFMLINSVQRVAMHTNHIHATGLYM